MTLMIAVSMEWWVVKACLEYLKSRRENWRGWWYTSFEDFYWKDRERNGGFVGGLYDRVSKMCETMVHCYANDRDPIDMGNWWYRKKRDCSHVRVQKERLSITRMGYISVVIREKENWTQIRVGLCMDILFGSFLFSHCVEWRAVVVH